MAAILERFAFPYFPSTYNNTLPDLEFVSRDDKFSERLMGIPGIQTIPIRFYNGNHKMTMIMCHGNSEDIGYINLAELSTIFNVNVCVFDYAGYGMHSCRVASESSCQEDVIAVYNYLIRIKQLNPEAIIVYGRSLGTYVACYLSNYLCNEIKQPPAKLILVSPLMSATKIITNFWSPVDILMNYILAPHITCSTLIIHGDKDTIVPYSCGTELSRLFPNLYQFITLHDIGHNNIFTPLYYSSIENFLRLGETSP